MVQGGVTLKRFAVMILVACICLSFNISYATESETLETLKSKAVSDSVDLLAIDSGILTLQENITSLRSNSAEIWELYDAYQKYKDLYNKGAHRLVMLTPIPIPPDADPVLAEELRIKNEQIVLNNQLVVAYQQLNQLFFNLFGIRTPSLTEEQIYDNFIYYSTVLPNNLNGQIDLLRIDRQRAEAGFKNGVETLWWNIGALRSQRRLTEDYRLLVRQQLTAVEKRFSLGRASEIEVELKKYDFEQALSNQKALERAIENLEYRLRHLSGIPFSEEFQVAISAPDYQDEALKSFEEYLRLAKRTRVDAIRALSSLYTLKQEENLMSVFITDPGHIRRLEVRQRRMEAEQQYQQLIKALDAEIFQLYHEALSAKESIILAEQNLRLATTDLSRLRALFSQGYLSEVDYEGARLMLVQAQINLENAKYQYALKVQQLNHSVTYGGSMGGAM